MGIVSESAIGFTGGRLAVGLSATIQLPAIDGQQSVEIEYSAGGTIFIAGFSAAAFGTGFLWGVTLLPFQYFPDYRGPLYFTAGGSTAVINWWKDLSIGT